MHGTCSRAIKESVYETSSMLRDSTTGCTSALISKIESEDGEKSVKPNEATGHKTES